jgi:glycogen debranching enzyme
MSADEERALQPALHDLVLTLQAPTVVASGADGQLRGTGAQGLLHADLRALSTAVLTVDDHEPEPVSSARTSPGTARFTGLLRRLGDAVPDPTVRVDRMRTVRPGRLHERVTLSSTATTPLRARVALVLASDHVLMDVIKAGGAGAPLAPRLDDGRVCWERDGVTTTVAAPGAALEVGARSAVASWAVELQPRGQVEIGWDVEVSDAGGVVSPARPHAVAAPVVRADDRRLARWLEASLADLDALRMVRSDRPDDAFAAAGAPWYLTLFGRDSIWAARMALPLGTGLAAGTLRTLAALQGSEHDGPTQQQPGKILHEVRRSATVLGSGTHLPPVYYGTVDATPLFVCLLHDAWRWGLPDDEVRALLPAARAALDWVVRWGDPDGDGLLEYVDTEGTGLANQGWKDSGDSVRFADGRQAEPPIALAEVQGYAHEALLHGADLLEAFGADDVAGYRGTAARLRERFAAAFWVDGADGRYPALALDGAKSRVDAVASNMGHLPGTGLLDAAEEAAVADVLTGPDNDSGLGLRTMSSGAGGYAPLSYHCGSVWPHDTAITLLALSRAGLGGRGAGLLTGLVEAAEAFGYRLPELWSGDALDEVGRPVPYPAACHPQAWSVTSAVAVLQVLLGLQVDVPRGVATLDPLRPSPVGALRVEGLLVAGQPCTVEVDASGEVLVAEGAGLRWDVRPGGTPRP